MPVPTGRSTGDLIQASDINDIATLLNSVESSVSSGVPYYIKPANTSVDIGALINSSLTNYGIAIVAPNPGSWWNLTTPISIGLGETLMGYGIGTCRIRAGSGLGANPMVKYRNGSDGDVTIRNLALNGNSIASQCIYIYQTTQPSSALANPDSSNIIDGVWTLNATGDGVYVGGSNAWGGNARETRILNCFAKGHGGWGFTIASSDMFMFNNTAHGNGPGGFRTVVNQAGNAKFTMCKAYYETVGMQLDASRGTVTGGEVQDCATGISVGADSYVATTICTCGNATNAALKLAGNGSTYAVHMTSRTPPGGSPATMQYAVECSSSTQILDGFINTNFKTSKYTNIWRTATRPNASSTLTVV